MGRAKLMLMLFLGKFWSWVLLKSLENFLSKDLVQLLGFELNVFVGSSLIRLYMQQWLQQ